MRSNRLPILAAEIAAEHAAVTTAANDFVHHAIEAGNRLLEAKALVSHGDWQDWLAEHVPGVSLRTAQRYMRAAKRVSKNDTVSFSTLREILEPDDEPSHQEKAAWIAQMMKLWVESTPADKEWFRLAIKIVGTREKIPEYLLDLDPAFLHKTAAILRRRLPEVRP